MLTKLKIRKFTLSLLLLSFFGLISPSTLAATNWKGNYYYARYFESTGWVMKRFLAQKVTMQNNSCGPTSLLFADAFFAFKSTGKVPAHLTTVQGGRNSLERLYRKLGKTNNTYTDLDELKSLARQWGWTSTRRRSSADSLEYNLNLLIQDLKEDSLALVAVRPGYARNPVGNFGHIMIVYGYERRKDGDVLKLFDPYFGGLHEFPRSDISPNGKSGAFDLVNFAYLKLKR